MMKLKKLGLACLFLAYAGQSLSAADTYQIQFGSAMGKNRDTKPTVVVGGEGELAGSELYWVCLDNYLDYPTGTLNFTVSETPGILKDGIWSPNPPAPGVEDYYGDPVSGVSLSTNAEVIATAIANIYFNNESAILSDYAGNDTGAGAAFQVAVWQLTTSYYWGLWSGPLTEEILLDKVAGMIHPDYTQAFAFLMSALDGTAAQGRQAYFGNIVVGDGGEGNTVQSLMLFKAVPDVIPEPSSVVLLIGAAGVVGFLSRRRNRSGK